MQSLDLENDEFLRLLTDALRAGPGSPQWHQAVLRVRGQEEAKGADEYKLLMQAREHLESGKEYRSVRAGAGFTRRVFQGIEDEADAASRAPSIGNLIAVVAALVILAVVVTVGFLLMRGGNGGQGDANDLARQVFTQTIVSTSFDGPLPAQWRPIGQLGLEVGKGRRGLDDQGLRLARSGGEKDAYLGGGIVTATPIPAGQTWAAEAELRPSRTAEGVITQLFVTDQTDFSPNRGTSGHELTVVLRGGRISILSPNGREEIQSKVEKGDISVRLAVNKGTAVIFVGEQRLWAGPHQLDAQKPRLFGVRLLRRGNDARDAAVVQSIRLLQP